MMETDLRRELNRFTSALRFHSAVAGAAWGVVAALGGGLLAAIAARATPLWRQDDLLLALVWTLGLGALSGAGVGYAWPRPLPQRLRLFDRNLHLADRLTTAWELEQGRIQAPADMVRLQREETLRRARSVDPQPAFPARPPRAAGIIALLLLLLLVPAVFLANPQEAELARREAQQQATEEAITQLETVRETLEQNTALTVAEREAALKALEEALAVLQDRRSTPTEQQAALAEAERQLAALHSAEDEARVQQLAEAAPLSTEEVVRPLAEALERGDLKAAASYLRDLADPASGRPLTSEEIQALADAFQQIADALRDTDARLAKKFQDIAQELYTGDAAGAQEAVKQAADALSEAAQANAPNQALEQAQAGVQQAQEGLGASQQATTRQESQGASAALSGQPGSGEQSASQGQSGGANAGDGEGASGHHEDAGSGAPYGPDAAPRLSQQGGEITVPRQEALGEPDITTGRPGSAQVPYQEVYATYAEAAEADLSHKAYPPALRAYVREYFNGLGE